jgi:hypothetical protein
MKFTTIALFALLCGGTVFAQEKNPGQATGKIVAVQEKSPLPGNFHPDSMCPEKNEVDKGLQSCCHGRGGMMSAGCPDRGGLNEPCYMAGYSGFDKPPRPFMGPEGFFMHHHPLPLPCLMLFGLLIIIVNILLTIITTLDMAKNKYFNGLWIPVMLIAGIPGAIIFALFRIGDKIQKN